MYLFKKHLLWYLLTAVLGTRKTAVDKVYTFLLMNVFRTVRPEETINKVRSK